MAFSLWQYNFGFLGHFRCLVCGSETLFLVRSCIVLSVLFERLWEHHCFRAQSETICRKSKNPSPDMNPGNWNSRRHQNHYFGVIGHFYVPGYKTANITKFESTQEIEMTWGTKILIYATNWAKNGPKITTRGQLSQGSITTKGSITSTRGKGETKKELSLWDLIRYIFEFI